MPQRTEKLRRQRRHIPAPDSFVLDEKGAGQPVEMTIDAIGGRKFTGKVDSISPATGAQFALLPPDNATGNFTKIVQRVPVKITLDPTDDATLAKLRPGLSVDASVDIRTRPDGPLHTLVGEEPVSAGGAAASRK